jgi:mannan endo-1,4-beta-mannosidase
MSRKKTITPVNPRASKEVTSLMEYLGQVSGNGIITGQHTQTTVQPELEYIQKVTGKLPALCGFELLGYSPNVDFENSDEECLKEVNENIGTLENAMDWAVNRKGLVTFTWHWFSPLGGCHKSFYTQHTDFNPEKALIEGSPENAALISDMDFMAEKLKAFRDKNIPILWRPFHEADGKWFWWGSKSFEASKQLFRLMYDRYTNHHDLNNLIWVWNSPDPRNYPGDDVVDIISRDLYPQKHTHTDLKKEYDELINITTSNKLAALGEIGTLPSVDQLSETRVPWCWYMTWSKVFCIGEEWNSNEELNKLYNSDYAITLDKLPQLY